MDQRILQIIQKHPELKSEFEEIYPELKESEDERIREEIIDFIQWAEDRGMIRHDYHQAKRPAEWIAYLEKQKEQNFEDIEDEAVRKYMKLDKFALANMLAERDKTNAEVIETFEGIEEQPAEWREDYREEDLRTRFAFYTYKDEDDVLYLSNVFVEETSRNKGFGTKILAAAEKVAETLGVIIIRLKVKQNSPANAWYRKHGYGFMAFEGDYDWLEKTLEYMKPVKPEWSEEDKVMLNNIIWGIHMKSIKPLDEMDDRSKYEKYEDFLKSLPDRFNLQPKQEWSEEDENKIESIKGLITMGRFADTNTIRDIWKLLDSLPPQPHWKPSEEQMIYLKEAINKFDFCDAENAGLQALYEQLKKLH